MMHVYDDDVYGDVFKMYSIVMMMYGLDVFC